MGPNSAKPNAHLVDTMGDVMINEFNRAFHSLSGLLVLLIVNSVAFDAAGSEVVNVAVNGTARASMASVYEAEQAEYKPRFDFKPLVQSWSSPELAARQAREEAEYQASRAISQARNLIQSAGVPVQLTSSIPGCGPTCSGGYLYDPTNPAGGSILINSSLPIANQFDTLQHEWRHAVSHRTDDSLNFQVIGLPSNIYGTSARGFHASEVFAFYESIAAYPSNLMLAATLGPVDRDAMVWDHASNLLTGERIRMNTEATVTKFLGALNPGTEDALLSVPATLTTVPGSLSAAQLITTPLPGAPDINISLFSSESNERSRLTLAIGTSSPVSLEFERGFDLSSNAGRNDAFDYIANKLNGASAIFVELRPSSPLVQETLSRAYAAEEASIRVSDGNATFSGVSCDLQCQTTRSAVERLTYTSNPTQIIRNMNVRSNILISEGSVPVYNPGFYCGGEYHCNEP